MTGVLDYGIGNIGSILNMIKKVGAQGAAVRTAEELSRCDRLILPGVGRFDAGMALLCRSGMRRALDRAVAQGVPLLGICLGMQMLFDESEEFGDDPADVLMTCDYGYPFPAAVGRGSVWGTQFHPEKSHRFGMCLIRNFVKEA